MSGRDFALSQHFPAMSATKVFKLFPKMSEGSRQVTVVWEMPQYSTPKGFTRKHPAPLSIARLLPTAQ